MTSRTKGHDLMKTTERTTVRDRRNNDPELLEYLQSILRCAYLSDLRREPYNSRAKQLMAQISLAAFPSRQVSDAVQYLCA